MGFPAIFDLTTLSGGNGFTINGELVGGHLGSSTSNAGDVNNDGINDIVIGAAAARPNGIVNCGQAYVIFGTRAFSSVVNISSLNGMNGFTINGISAHNYLGFSVSSAGDINHDGKDDVAIGAIGTGYDNSNTGQVYVIFGATTFPSTLNVSTLNGINGFTIVGINSGDSFGASVSSVGDINKDDKSDLIIGAPSVITNGNVGVGQAYVIFGASTFPKIFNVSILDGTNGFIINGNSANSHFGWSTSGAGDINKDGINDVIVGAYGAKFGAGQAYVIFGSTTFPQTFNVSSLNGNSGFVVNSLGGSDHLGYSVSGAGDINNDGISDVAIGAHVIEQAYVIFGSKTFINPFNLNSLNGSNGFSIKCLHSGDMLGSSVMGLSDVNGDGITDLAIAAVSAAPQNKTTAGQVYVIFGSTGGFSSVFNLDSLNGDNGFVVNGLNPLGNLGSALGGVQDVNGDNIGDLIIGADGINGSNISGQVYVIFGADIAQEGVLSGSAIAGAVIGSILGASIIAGTALLFIAKYNHLLCYGGHAEEHQLLVGEVTDNHL